MATTVVEHPAQGPGFHGALIAEWLRDDDGDAHRGEVR